MSLRISAYGRAKTKLEDADTNLGSVDQQAVTAALNFHILPTKVFDLWLAPIVFWYVFGDFEFDDAIDSEDVELNTEWDYGAQVGPVIAPR